MIDVDLTPLWEPKSKVLDVPAAEPVDALRFFLAKLEHECDPSDVWHDMQNGTGDFVVLDVRGPEAYAERHVPGARSLPHWTITPEGVEELGLAEDVVYVTYCWGPHCNAATKAGAKLSALGYRAKEMIGGIPGWEAEGLPFESS